MNSLAQELNEILADTCAIRLFSEAGRRIYFPKGILSQSAEAKQKAHRYNATIGMAYQDGSPLILDAIKEQLPSLQAEEAVAYAPTSGVAQFRDCWQQELFKKNPSLNGAALSLPVVVPGLTAGISFLADMFVNMYDAVVVPDMFWPNYRLILEERKHETMSHYPFFNSKGGFNLEGFEKTVRASARQNGKALVILNFPNNPTGYTPTVAEGQAIASILESVASEGFDILVIADDAYFGLQYEDMSLHESIFALLANKHERILAAKVDGSTKEDFVWGFRGGFVTFGCKGMDRKHYEALEKKLMGIIRSSISSSPSPTQYILLKAIEHPSYHEQKEQFKQLLLKRYQTVKRFLEKHPCPSVLKTLPFNSGYFMCFECNGINAEILRLHLLNTYGIGTISIQEKWLRVAFSSVNEEHIEDLYAHIFKAAEECK